MDSGFNSVCGFYQVVVYRGVRIIMTEEKYRNAEQHIDTATTLVSLATKIMFEIKGQFGIAELTPEASEALKALETKIAEFRMATDGN